MSEELGAQVNALGALLDPDLWLRMTEERRRADRDAVEAAGVAMGEGASDQAYELVAKGLLYEKSWAEEVRRRIQEGRNKRGRGQPRKAKSKDVARAELLLNLKASGYGTADIPSWVVAIARAEERFVTEGDLQREECLFAHSGTAKSVSESVSRGLGRLGLTAAALVE